MSQEKRTLAEETMADIYRRAMLHVGLLNSTDPDPTHPSDSAVQRAAEVEMIAELGKRIGLSLSSSTISLPNGVSVQVDGVDDARTVLVEAYARETALKPGNTRKIAQDALKLVWLGKEIGATRIVIALSSDIAARTLLHGKGWMKSAFADLGVEVFVIPVSEPTHHALLKAQLAQVR